MAYGNYNNNSSNGKNDSFSPNYYGGTRLRDETGELSIIFSYWKAMMKISIRSFSPNNDHPEDLASIYLSSYKAYILASQIDEVLNAKDKDKDGKEKPKVVSFGINSGNKPDEQSVMIVGRNDDKKYFVTIGITDTNGRFKSKQDIVFPKNDSKHSNFGLNINKASRGTNGLDFEIKYYDETPMVLLKYALEDFARASSGASSAVGAYVTRWNSDHIHNNLYLIMKKLGVQTSSRYNGNGGSNGAAGQWFANGGKSSTPSDFGMNAPEVASDDDGDFDDLSSID